METYTKLNNLPTDPADKLITKSGTYYVLVKGTSPFGKDYYGFRVLNVMFPGDKNAVVFKNTSSYKLNREFILNSFKQVLSGHGIHQNGSRFLTRALTTNNYLYLYNQKSTINAGSVEVYDRDMNPITPPAPIALGNINDAVIFNDEIYLATSSGITKLNKTDNSIVTLNSSGPYEGITVWRNSILTATDTELQSWSPSNYATPRKIRLLDNPAVTTKQVYTINSSGNLIYVTYEDGKISLFTP